MDRNDNWNEEQEKLKMSSAFSGGRRTEKAQETGKPGSRYLSELRRNYGRLFQNLHVAVFWTQNYYLQHCHHRYLLDWRKTFKVWPVFWIVMSCCIWCELFWREVSRRDHDHILKHSLRRQEHLIFHLVSTFREKMQKTEIGGERSKRSCEVSVLISWSNYAANLLLHFIV